MYLLYIMLAVLDNLGLLNPWLLVVVGVLVILLWFDIVSVLITIDLMIRDYQSC